MASEAKKGDEAVNEAKKGDEVTSEAKKGDEATSEAKKGDEATSEAKKGDKATSDAKKGDKATSDAKKNTETAHDAKKDTETTNDTLNNGETTNPPNTLREATNTVTAKKTDREAVDSGSSDESDSDQEGVREVKSDKLKVVFAWQLEEGVDHNWTKLAGGVDETKKAVELHHKFASLRNEIDGYYIQSEPIIKKVEESKNNKITSKKKGKLEEAAEKITEAYKSVGAIKEETEENYKKMEELRDKIKKYKNRLNHIWISFGPGGRYFIDGLGEDTGTLNVYTQDPKRTTSDHYKIGMGRFTNGEPDGRVMIYVPKTNIVKTILDYKEGKKQFVYIFSGNQENNVLIVCERFENGKKVERAEFFDDGKLKRCVVGWEKTDAEETAIPVDVIEFLKNGQVWYVGPATCDASKSDVYNYTISEEGIQYNYDGDKKILFVRKGNGVAVPYEWEKEEKKYYVEVDKKEFVMMKDGSKYQEYYSVFGVLLTRTDKITGQTFHYFPTLPKQKETPFLSIEYDIQIPSHLFGDKIRPMYWEDRQGKVFDLRLNYREDLLKFDA